MKDYLFGGLVTIAILGLLSYTTTDGGRTDNGSQGAIYNIPLKQQRVVTTSDIDYVNKLVKKGYVVEFVTENSYRNAKTTYTLIKY
jgi:hypothetical protein